MPPKSASKTAKKDEKKAPARPTRCGKDFKWAPKPKVGSFKNSNIDVLGDLF